jgi:iron(II)-dependent oxidoreductase
MAILLMLPLLLALPQNGPPAGMALIPAGEFWMGRVHMFRPDEQGYFLRLRIDDVPAHLIHIDSFYIDKQEVTHDAYARFVQAASHRAPFHWKDGRIPEGHGAYPVYNVNWDDADAYCRWAGKRLPTEAEWEKAARGGLDKKRYPWGDELRPGAKSGEGANAGAEPPANAGAAAKVAQYGVPNGPTGVGSFKPNDYGLYDVIGNVAEWVSDWYDRTYYVMSPDSNPKGPASGMYRVIRGSSWVDPIETGDAVEPRVYGVHFRNFLSPFHRTNTVGFRCAMTP